MRLVLFFAVCIFCFGCQNAPETYRDVVVEGDFVFQDLDCGPLCEAIEAVTYGVNDRDFSHLGLVIEQAGQFYALEAIGTEVQLTPLDTFMQRTDRFVISRLNPDWRPMIPMVKQYGLSKLGAPYDDAFLPDNDRYYCSELIAEAFQVANSGMPFFQQFPMTFKNPSTGAFFPTWVEYYAKLELEIPEGTLGCNPGGMSLDHKLAVVFQH